MKPGIELLPAEILPQIAGAPDANRQQWVHILPAISVVSRDGREFAIDNLDAVVEASRRWAGSRRMLIDYEHQSLYSRNNGKPVPAAGWIVGMEVRDDGIWALAEWTQKAADMIAAREYRYLSPTLICEAGGKVNRIRNVALTNEPAINELAAVAKVESEMKPESIQQAEASANAALNQLRELLGLSEADGLEAVLEAVRQMLEKPAAAGKPDPAKYVPIGEFQQVTAELNKLRQGVTQEAAKAHVDEQVRTGRLAPFMSGWATELCTVNKPAFDDFMAKTGPAFQQIVEPLHARFSGTPGAAGRPGFDNEIEAEVATKLGLTADEFKAAQKR
ncbi:MAG: phage protease [Nitratireductor sp.]